MDIESLLQKLFNLEYVSGKSYDGGSRRAYSIIGEYDGQQTIVRNAVEEWYLEQKERQNVKIAELEAKIYAYEKIIANSNFKPLLNTEGGVDNG